MQTLSPKSSILSCCKFVSKILRLWIYVLIVSYYDKIIKSADTIQKKSKTYAFIFSVFMFGLLIFWMQEASFMSERIFISVVYYIIENYKK